MLSFDIEQENLEELIEQKREEIEATVKVEEEDDQKIYPLFRNYPNGTADYYLKLKSIDFKNWKNEFRIAFIDKTILGDKYYNLLKRLGFKVLKQNFHNKEIKNYNLIVSNNKEYVSKLMTTLPIIYINCRPGRHIDVDKRNNLFYYDNEKEYKKYKYYFYANDVQCIYRKNVTDFIDAVSKIKEMR